MEAFKKIRLCLAMALVGSMLLFGCQEEGLFPNPDDATLCTGCPPPPPEDPSCEDCD